MKTVSGREVSVTTAFRLPLTDYQRAQELAEREGVKLSVVMRKLVADGLAVWQDAQSQTREAANVKT